MMVCSKCGLEKPEESFSFRHKDFGIHHKRCKACINGLVPPYYKNHDVIVVEKKVKYLLEHPCVDCGETDPLVLDFDHVVGKKFKNITSMLVGRYSWPNILKEIAKCVVRCANCHRRKTAKERNWKQVEVIERLRRESISRPEKDCNGFSS